MSDIEAMDKLAAAFASPKFPEVQGFRIAALSRPAGKLGGDICLLCANRFLFLGDLEGHALGQAFSAQGIAVLARQASRKARSGKQLLLEIDKEIRAIKQEDHTFPSLAALVLDLQDFTIAVAGGVLTPLQLSSQDPTAVSIVPVSKAPRLGVGPRTVLEQSLDQSPVELKPQDSLLLATDGFEAIPLAQQRNKQYQKSKLFHAVLARPANGDVLKHLEAFVPARPSRDDVLLVTVEKTQEVL